jgi:hypothetical protein
MIPEADQRGLRTLTDALGAQSEEFMRGALQLLLCWLHSDRSYRRW